MCIADVVKKLTTEKKNIFCTGPTRTAKEPDNFPAYDKPESAKPRQVIFRDFVMPESHLAKSEKRI